MKEATHFIELWNKGKNQTPDVAENKDSAVAKGLNAIYEMRLLQDILNETKLIKYETVAIFKIYPKTSYENR